jgi:hypothetical protein
MSIIRKSNGAILAPNRIIRDGSDPCKCCGCKECRVPNTTTDPICDCLPIKFLVVLTGLDANCDCFVVSTGIPPTEHFESSGNDYNGSYCMTGFDGVLAPYNATLWDGTGGGTDCGPPNAVDGASSDTDIGLIVQFDDLVDGVLVGVHIRFFITGGYGRIGDTQIFHGEYAGDDCEGPWVVNNRCTDCRVVDHPNEPGSSLLPPEEWCYGAGGTAIIYPCGCP